MLGKQKGTMMKTCIYCKETKSESEFSLEHVIPQFLGGAFSTDRLKTNDVCKKCNSALGLFVDAAFAKSQLVNNQLIEMELKLRKFNPVAPISLRYIGNAKMKLPRQREDEDVELWFGPFGEQVYFLRPRDDRMFWYVGGNPRTTRDSETRAYMLMSINSQKDIKGSLNSFKTAFFKKTRHILCTKTNLPPEQLGFSIPDDIDIERITFLNSIRNEEKNAQMKMYLDFDLRFIAKVAYGIKYCLLGNESLDSDYSKELLKAIKYNKDTEAMPKIEYAPFMSTIGNSEMNSLGYSGAVTIMICIVEGDLILNINIDKRYTVACTIAKSYELMGNIKQQLEDGIVIVLYRSLQKGFTFKMSELGSNEEINEMERKLNN